MSEDKLETGEPLIESPKQPETPKVQVTGKEKEEFFKAMLADKPFISTSKLFEGKLNIKFKTLTIVENNDVLKQITLDQDKGVAKNTNEYFTRIAQYRLAVSIEQINNQPFAVDFNRDTIGFNNETGESYITKRTEILDKWQTPKLAGVLQAFRDFENKVLHMTNMMEDPNFWKAAV